MSTLVLPDASLVVLIGAAGSGKSSLAARLFTPDEVVSSDALRAVVSGSEADQRASAIAFRILHRTVERRLTNGETAVVDATNTRAEHRRPLLARARAAGVPAVAIVLDLPPAQIHAQNADRAARVVGPEIVDRHLVALRRTLDLGQLTTEGFEHVVLLRWAADVARLRLERRRPARPRERALQPNRRR